MLRPWRNQGVNQDVGKARSRNVREEFPSAAQIWHLTEGKVSVSSALVNNGGQQSHDGHAGEQEQDLQQRLPGKQDKSETRGHVDHRGQITATKGRRGSPGINTDLRLDSSSRSGTTFTKAM